MNVVKIRSSVPLVKILEVIQRRRPDESCDTHIMCQDGYIPCHRYILMANSPFLKALILDNLKETGNPDYKTVITLSIPDIKTGHMAQVIAMFYSGISICKLDDLYYVMNILKLIGIEFGEREKSQLKTATTEEIEMYCKPRYYLDPDSDSDEDVDNGVANQFTTNAFSALAQKNSVAETAQTAVRTEQPGPSSAIPKMNNEVKSTTTGDDPAEMEVDSSEEETTPAPEPIQKNNPVQPKVTPISIKALMDKQIARKRGRPSFRKDDEEKESKKESKSENRGSSKTSKDKKSERKKEPANPKANKDHPSDSDDGSSDDSVVSSVKRKSSLRSKKEVVESSRRTPVRKCRLTAEVVTPTSTELPSALKKPNEAGGSVKKHKQVLFKFTDDDNHKNRPKEDKCFFCSEIFPNSEVLEKHLSESCGKHLNGKYCRSGLLCNLCDKDFPTFSLWGLIRHVNMCAQNRSSPDYPTPTGRKTIEPPKYTIANPQATKEKPEKVKENEKTAENKKPQSDDDDDDVCSEEEIQVYDSLQVKVVRHNFQKPKVEDKADDIPEKLVAPTLVSNLVTNTNKGQEKQAGKRPIVITRALPGKVKNTILKYYERLRDCRFCMEAHSNISEATHCLTEHGYQICWICFQTYDSPTLEDHYEEFHDVEGKPGFVFCPLCKSSCKYSNLHTHMNEAHFSSVSSTGSPNNNLEVLPKDRKRKRDEDDNEKRKRIIPDDNSSSSNQDSIPMPKLKAFTTIESTKAKTSTTVTENAKTSGDDVMAKPSTNNENMKIKIKLITGVNPTKPIPSTNTENTKTNPSTCVDTTKAKPSINIENPKTNPVTGVDSTKAKPCINNENTKAKPSTGFDNVTAKAPQTGTENSNAATQRVDEEKDDSGMTAAESDGDVDLNLTINWDKFNEGIHDYRKSKGTLQDEASGKEIVAVSVGTTHPHLIQHNNIQGLGVSSSTSLVPTKPIEEPTDMQLFLQTATPEPKLKVTPSLVASRFFELMNEPTPFSSKNLSPIIYDDNQPSTSRAALMSMSPQKPLDYSTQNHQSDFAANLTVPKIPALEQSKNTTSSQIRGPDSIVARNQQEPFRYTPHIRNPLPGDRLYCGTIAVDNQNFRCFKVHPDTTASAVRIPSIQYPTFLQANENKEGGKQQLQPPN